MIQHNSIVCCRRWSIEQHVALYGSQKKFNRPWNSPKIGVANINTLLLTDNAHTLNDGWSMETVAIVVQYALYYYCASLDAWKTRSRKRLSNRLNSCTSGRQTLTFLAWKHAQGEVIGRRVSSAALVGNATRACPLYRWNFHRLHCKTLGNSATFSI